MVAYFFIQNCFKCDYDHHSTEYCCIWQRTNNFVTEECDVFVNLISDCGR